MEESEVEGVTPPEVPVVDSVGRTSTVLRRGAKAQSGVGWRREVSRIGSPGGCRLRATGEGLFVARRRQRSPPAMADGKAARGGSPRRLSPPSYGRGGTGRSMAAKAGVGWEARAGSPNGYRHRATEEMRSKADPPFQAGSADHLR